ncbi:hypothetical protein ACWDWO_19460 [Actinopolymorpha singaporensis]|uniref:Uncharacterized protein n=1 Tax=Actinopolymorpha singaporensis TaxID=117157 RepID=A0A1H1WD90_9ACTN|nr:hypothetical protein [Actinopolymorpha singaporensis]SDS94985.1 hypothetical protein SAMN04489717_4462 [Actinopolymorpha singaporensis]
MLRILLIIAIVWLVLSILGFLVKGLLWLGFVALVLFLATAAWGWVKRNSAG